MHIKNAILSGIICNMVIWYELTLFGVLASIISKNFLPSEDTTGIFLGIFAVGFLFRPFGAFIFGYMGDKYGRRKVLLISVALASISSTAVGIIPSFKTIGFLAPMLLLFCRIIQGAAAGGETSINSAFLIEHSDTKKNIGFLGSIKAFSGALGSIVCLIVIAICEKLTGANYETWGWRLPFCFCSLMGIIGFLIRYIMSETLAYKIHGKDNHYPLWKLIKNYKRPFAISIGAGIAQNAVVYSAIMFYNVSVQGLIFSGIDIKNTVRICVDTFFGISAILFATVSDKYGRKNIMLMILTLLACTSLLILPLLSSGNSSIIITTYLLLAIPIGAAFGIYNSLVCELFPTQVRCIGFSLANNMSAGIFGGISPYICRFFLEKTGGNLVASIYLFSCVIISLISVLLIRTQDKQIDW